MTEPDPLFNADTILEIQKLLPMIHGTAALFTYIVQLAEASRQHPDLALGASPRASLFLLKCACAARFWTAAITSLTKTCKRLPTASWAIASSSAPKPKSKASASPTSSMRSYKP